MARPFGELFYTLTNLVVATYNTETDVWGLPTFLQDGRMFGIEPEADTDKLASYGTFAEGLTVLKGATLKFAGGGLDWEVLQRIATMDYSESGLSGNRKRRAIVNAGGGGMGYFSAIGEAATTTGGVAVFGMRKVKINNFPNIQLDGESNKFSSWETEGYGFTTRLGDGTYELFVHETYEDPADWTRPATANDMGTFFNGA